MAHGFEIELAVVVGGVGVVVGAAAAVDVGTVSLDKISQNNSWLMAIKNSKHGR